MLLLGALSSEEGARTPGKRGGVDLAGVCRQEFYGFVNGHSTEAGADSAVPMQRLITLRIGLVHVW